jgi:hypothetical protein
MTVIDARDRFMRRRQDVVRLEGACRDCRRRGTVLVFPHIDGRSKPWPLPYRLCAKHAGPPPWSSR